MPKSPLLKRKASIADLEDITKIQCSNGNWNYDPYMQGLANGMILSLHTVKDLPGEPVFKHAPETWLADIHVDPNDPAHQPIPMTAATPKILYWGGRPGAKELIPQNSNYRAGIWLTDSIKVAASFGREIYRVEVTGLNNPFIVDAQGEFYAEIPTPPEMVSEGFTFLNTCDSDLIVQFALQRGHDSVVIKNVVEGFSGGGVGLSHQSGTDYVLLKEGQGKIVSSFDYKSTLDVWGMPKDPKFSAASKKAETAYTDEDLEEWLADLHVDPVEGGTVPMTAADKTARPDQWETPEFKAWFAGSKVVDSKGKPMRVYHGTSAEFDAFKEDFVGQNFGDVAGFFFTNNTSHEVVHKGPGKVEILEDMTSSGGYAENSAKQTGGSPSVMPCYIKLLNPLVIDKDLDGAGILSAIEERNTPAGDFIRDEVIGRGYDGLIVIDRDITFKNGEPEMLVVATRANQIKSAIGNSGKFTPDDPRLTAGTHTAAAIDATNWEDYLVPTEEGISEEDLKQVVAASGLTYAAFQTNPLVVTLGDQYLLVKDGQEFFVEEDWGQVLEDIEYDIPFLLLNWIHGRFRLDSEFLLDRKILKLEGYYFRLDHTKKEGDLIPDIEQWVRDLDDSDIWDLVGDPDELYNDVIGSSLKDFHEQPSDVYHYTTEENLEEIIASGELETTSGTGLTNRMAAGVFTSIDPEEYADGTYGDVCLEIDLPAFLRDHPDTRLSFEPEIEECLAQEQVVSSLGLSERINIQPDSSGGMSYGTIIVGSTIPLKYIKVDGNPLEPKKASKKEATPAKTARPDQWDAPGFAAWFQRSAVIDDEGDPLPVVHRTDADFKRFSSKFLGLNTDGNASDEDLAQTAHIGFWFASKESNLDSMSGDRSVPCYLSIQEPTYYPSLSALAIAIRDAGGARKFRTQCQSAGHDGVIVEDEEFEGTSYVAFRPTQIKSALANKGRFNPNSPDITASAKTARPDQWGTPAFQSWFSGSKVVDAEGSPLVCYHGTMTPGFDTFLKGMGHHPGSISMFSTEKEYADRYTNGKGATYPVYLRIRKPLDLRGSGDILDRLPDELWSRMTREERVAARDFSNSGSSVWCGGHLWLYLASKYGFDGVVWDESGTTWVPVSESAQVKSAIGNSGEFNPEDHRITASVAYKPFADASVEEKVERLATHPYHSDRYYHVTNPAAIQSILTTGLKGAEIWVSKGQPWKEYIEGACLELNLEGMELHPDTRWVEEAQTLVAIEPIPASRITRVFDWISEWDMREDQAAKFLSRRGKDEVREQVMSKFAKVEWDLSPVEDHERAIKLSYKGKLGPNFEVFIYPRQDKGFDCDVHVVTGYGKRNPGVGGNKPYAPCVDFNGTELATAQALATEIKKCMDQELNSLADAARSKGDKALAYNLTREAANLYQEVLNDVTKMLVKLPNPRTDWGKPKASSQGAQARYEALVAELQAIEAKTGLYLTDTNVDRENVGAGDEQSDEFWNSMCYAAEQAAGMRAENAGQDINTLLGRTIY